MYDGPGVKEKIVQELCKYLISEHSISNGRFATIGKKKQVAHHVRWTRCKEKIYKKNNLRNHPSGRVNRNLFLPSRKCHRGRLNKPILLPDHSRGRVNKTVFLLLTTSDGG